MLYCDYAAYTAQGGTLSEELFPVWARRASALIDRLTMGRAAQYAEDEAIGPQLADACAQLVDLLNGSHAARVRAASGLGSARTNDGYSETYLDAAQLDRQTAAQARAVLRDALGHDPKNLLYGGVCGCVPW